MHPARVITHFMARQTLSTVGIYKYLQNFTSNLKHLPAKGSSELAQEDRDS